MKPTFSTKWRSVLLGSCIALATVYVAWACSGGDWEIADRSNYTPEVFVTDQTSLPFVYDDLNFYYSIGHDETYNERFAANNVANWEQYLGKSADKAAIHYYLNKATKKDVANTRLLLQGKAKTLPKTAAAYASFVQNKDAKITQFFDYLWYAKNCEDFAVIKYDWYDSDGTTTETDKDAKPDYVFILDGLTKGYQAASEPFLKQRYWFQLVRYHYFFATTQAISLFEAGAANSSKNSLYYRTMAYAAGAMYKQGNYAKANYYYSLVFANCDALKTVAHFSFHPQEETDWQKTLAMAKTNDEKATLWQMLGIFYADEARSIQQIYQLDPKNPRIDLLLTRLVNKLESTPLYGYWNDDDDDDTDNSNSYTNANGNFDEAKYAAYERRRTEAYEAKRQQRITQDLKWLAPIATKGNTANPFLWSASVGYLQSLAGQHSQATALYLQAQQQLPSTPIAAHQLRLLELLNNTAALKNISSKDENNLLTDLKWLYAQDLETNVGIRIRNAQEQIRQNMASAYEKQGDFAKAECFVTNTLFYTKPTQLAALKALFSKKDATPFERFCQTMSEKKLGDIYEYEAIKAAYNDQLADAVVSMQMDDAQAQKQLLGNPFNSKIPDCHDCDHSSPLKTPYTKLSFLQKMLEMKQKVDAKTDVFNNALLLGNAFYNMSHYGNARLFYQSAVIPDCYATDCLDPNFEAMLISQATAEKYYQLALKNAANDEQKAKCYYLLSKCERNKWYETTYPQQSYDDPNHKDFTLWTWFKELKKLPNTQYYKDVIHECGYFRDVARR